MKQKKLDIVMEFIYIFRRDEARLYMFPKLRGGGV